MEVGQGPNWGCSAKEKNDYDDGNIDVDGEEWQRRS
jgi:hypothetical protein